MRSLAPVLRVAGVLLILPVILLAARFGLAWPPAPQTRVRLASPARPLEHRSAVPVAVAVVYVAGAVARPGLITLPAGSRVAAAVARARPRPEGDLVAVNLAARVEDGEEIVVPVHGAQAAVPRPAKRGRRAPGRSSQRRSVPPSEPVSLNRADARALATVPGIDARVAGRIIAYRETYGPFAAVDDLLDVAGITEGSLARAAPYLQP
ncbi:helix-hairpin-helix domain-containing protein [bacterium]|nr:MAG: helix-hairpin-helix domain-containing protein [bacterium]